jgi:iron complex outermembrane receptor protein
LTDRLTLTAGARYTLEHRDFTFHGIYDDLTGNPITPVPGALVTTPGGYAAINNFSYAGGKSWTSFTPKGGISYQFTQDIYGYASVSQGFDAGGFNNRASSLATALPYNQETVTAYEGGLKTEWLNRSVRLNLTGFYNHFKGLQETASVVSPITGGYVSVRSNANAAHSDGVEIESVAKPTDNLTLTLNASFLETRFDSFPNANAAVIGGVATLISATGNQLPISPHWQLYGAVNYRVPLPFPGELDLGFDAVSVSPYFSDVFNTARARVPEQTFLDANASYRPPGGRLVITLTARNLADHFAYQSLTYGGTPSLWEGPMNPPRTIFVKIAYTL